MAFLSKEITDAANVLREGISSGQGAARTSLGGGGRAFAWTGNIRSIADHLETDTADGMSFPYTVVTESGTPATIVTEGSQKPLATEITESTGNLPKHAGRGEMTLEQALSASGLGGAIKRTLAKSCIKSFEASAIAAIAAGKGDTVTGADWVQAIANGQASVVTAGGSPSVVVLSSREWGAVSADILSTSAFSQSPESPVGALLGSPIHLSSGLAPGTAYVLDGAAAVAVQHSAGPLAVLDVYTLADVNKARLILDLVAGVIVTESSMVCEITAPVV